MRPWLAEYLQQSFEYAEYWSTELWAETQDWCMGMVREVLRITELDQKGHIVMGDAEVGLQIKWRREGNWRAGSTPLVMPRRNGALESIRAAVSRNRENNRDLSGAVRPRWALEQKPAATPPQPRIDQERRVPRERKNEKI
jgi:hypothetical protein